MSEQVANDKYLERQLKFIARNTIYGLDTEKAAVIMKRKEKEFLQDLLMEQQEQM